MPHEIWKHPDGTFTVMERPSEPGRKARILADRVSKDKAKEAIKAADPSYQADRASTEGS